MTELRVDPPELSAGATGLEGAANSIPEPLAPFTAAGTDALSTILSTLTQEKESPLIAGLPAAKAEALATVQKILQAAGIYEQTDQQIAGNVRRATEGLDGPIGGTPGAGGAGPTSGAGSAGGSGQLQQMMGMPMQMAQQAGQMAPQALQGIAQGVQNGIQQVSQMPGGVGQKGDSQAGGEGPQPDPRDEKPEDKEKAQPAAPEGAAPGQNNAERAPDAAPQTDAPQDTSQSGAVPDAGPPTQGPMRPATPDPGIVV